METLSTYEKRFQREFARDYAVGNVTNLSKYSFTKNQFKVLNKNLNFCLTPGYYSKKEIKTEIKKNFEREIKHKASFLTSGRK